MNYRNYPFPIFCITSGVFLTAEFSLLMLQFGYALEPEVVTWLSIILVISFMALTQLGFFLAPKAVKNPRPAGYVVVLFCFPWLLMFGSQIARYISTNFQLSRFLLIVMFGFVANAIVLWAVGSKLIATFSETDEAA